MKYARKPITVEAILWNGYDGVFEIVEEMASPQPVDRQGNDALAIHTLQGTRTAHIGDYVCKADDGAVFVMAPGPFGDLYYPIDEEEEES